LLLGAYLAIHRASAAQRHVRAQRAVRDALIRTRYVNVGRARSQRKLDRSRSRYPRGVG
jgi:hypothetical protein